MTTYSLLISSLLLFSLISSAYVYANKLPIMLFGRPRRGFIGHGDFLHERRMSIESNAAEINPLNIDQPVDNFDASNTATYKQRYWYNQQFSQNKNIVFLMIQGEGPADSKWVTNPGYQYLQWAKEFGADVFQLEHRCFGFSRPYPDMTVEHLKVCTMEQALADISTFIKKMNAQYGFTNPQWITFGGSYPGTLSAIFRMLHPDQTVGAVASSAPLLWTFDFFQYAQVVEDVLRQTDPDCAKAVGDAFSTMQQNSLSNDGRKSLSQTFNLDPPFQDDKTTQLDIDNFFSNIYGYYQTVIQYTYDGRAPVNEQNLTAREICSIMTNNAVDVVLRVKQVVDYVNLNLDGSSGPLPNNYTDMIQQLRNTTFDDENGGLYAAARGWMWLSCNQFGVLQTTDQGRNIFQQSVPLNYYIDMCTAVFDQTVNVVSMRDNNIKVFETYGGNDGYKATNVVLPNGSFDPWHVLGSNVTDTRNLVTPILIYGMGHCSDMYPSYEGEPSTLDPARKQIRNQIAKFLGLE